MPPPLPLPLPLPLRDADAFHALAREEVHLRQSLQASIDAQSEGLLAGFAAVAASSNPDEASSSSSSPGRRTGTARSESGASRNGRGRGSMVIMPVRQPAPPQRLGLQGARRGIARAMAQLEGLKAHEEELLEVALAAHEEDLAVAEALGRKREGLEASIRGIEMEDSNRQVQGLCDEERLLDEEIRDLETKLAGMKTRHRHLRAEIEGLDNRVQSQLSSYRAALTLAEKETRNFLARPSSSSSALAPARTTATTTTTALASGTTRGNQSNLWDLPVGRRTLPMAQEQFRDEQRMLLKRIAEVDEERTALEEGKQVWADVVQEVTSVEQLLRDEMLRLDQPTSLPTQGLPPETSAAAAAAGGDHAHSMHAVLQHIDAARKRVEQHWRTSVARRWGLLVCCVGAELEALVQGSAVLRATLGGDSVLGGEGEGEGLDGDGSIDGDGMDRDGMDRAGFAREGDGKPDLQPRGSHRREEIPAPGGTEAEEDDDGPGADLLVSGGRLM